LRIVVRLRRGDLLGALSTKPFCGGTMRAEARLIRFARFPLGWDCPSDKKSRKIKMLGQVLSTKAAQLLRNLL